ncbi:hypothetical protein KAS50_04120 [bacterium]|nr:hypothetical protein [bacterium]
MIAQKASFTINHYATVPKSFSGYYRKSQSVGMQQPVRTRAKIPDDLKAGSTFVKKVEVVVEKGGFRINLVR